MSTFQALLTIASVSLVAPGALATVSAASVQDEEFSTIFNDTGGPSAAGSAYAPTLGQNAIGSVATFSFPGNIVFMQSHPYYVSGNNVSWGFAGAGRADITFTQGASSVSLAVRGTSLGDIVGAAAIYPFNPGTALVDAAASVWALDQIGNFIAGSQQTIQNLSLLSTAMLEINYSSTSLGQDIFGLAFVQNINNSSAGLMVGGLGFTTVPTPGNAAIICLGALCYGRRRR